MSINSIGSCLSSKVFPREENKDLVVSILVLTALLCLSASLLSQFHIYSGLSLAGRMTLFALSGAISFVALMILCINSKPKVATPLENYIHELGYPTATVQKRITKPSQTLGKDFEDHVFTVKLDGAQDVVVFTNSILINNTESTDFGEKLRFRHALFEKKLQIKDFLSSIEDYEIAQSLQQEEGRFFADSLNDTLHRFIPAKFERSFRHTSDTFNYDKTFTVSFVLEATNKSYTYSSENRRAKFVLEAILLMICEDLYQFPSQKMIKVTDHSTV